MAKDDQKEPKENEGSTSDSKLESKSNKESGDDRRRKRKKERKKHSSKSVSVSRSKSKSRSKSRSRSKDDRKSRSSDRDRDRDRRRRRKRESEKSRKKKKKKNYSSSSSSSSDDDSSSSSSDSDSDSSSDSGSDSSNNSGIKQNNKAKKRKVVNKRLLAKLAERGETLEEREERRAERRTARITAQFGYTAQDNPFNDPNIADKFTWKKKEEHDATTSTTKDKAVSKDQQGIIFEEIEKVRKRRRDYEEQKEEMERIRAEESRMKEHEKYDEWAQKEELFHLQQQKHRSAIRLVEGREKPIDVLAKNLLLFGLTEEEKQNRASVKYKEKYNALEEIEALEAELEEPHVFISCLKLNELEELLGEIEVFRSLENDVGDAEYKSDEDVIRYWDFLHLVTKAEIQHIRSHNVGTKEDSNVKKEIQNMFEGQSKSALEIMKQDVETKVKKCIVAGGRPVFDEKEGGVIDLQYWQIVLDQLLIHLAKMELSDMHSKMLVCQLEKLEQKKEDLEQKQKNGDTTTTSADDGEAKEGDENEDAAQLVRPVDVAPDFGNLEEELGLTSEIDLGLGTFIEDKYRARKPRYFNRVKTGYDWNKYNQTHYDFDNPPPKIVQGYKFNIFYPDLFDKTTTPKYTLEPTDSPEFCIIRFSCGPPYEDIAFKIINRQWNKSRKRGFKCTFERGVLSLYINFATHYYRR